MTSYSEKDGPAPGVSCPTDTGTYINGNVTSVTYNSDTQLFGVSYVTPEGVFGQGIIAPSGPDTSTLLGLLGEAGCGPMGGCPQNPNPPAPCQVGASHMKSCQNGNPTKGWWRTFLTTLVKRPNTGPGSCLGVFADTVTTPLQQLQSAVKDYIPLMVSAMQAAPAGASLYVQQVGRMVEAGAAEADPQVAAVVTTAGAAAGTMAPYVSAAAPYAGGGVIDATLAVGLVNEVNAGLNGQCHW